MPASARFSARPLPRSAPNGAPSRAPKEIPGGRKTPSVPAATLRGVRPLFSGGLLGRPSGGLARPGPLLPEARPGGRRDPAGALRLDHPLPESAPRGCAPGYLAEGVQLRPHLRAFPGARRRPRARAAPGRRPRGPRPRRPRRRPLSPELRPRLPRFRLRHRDRGRLLDPLRPTTRPPLRRRRRHHSRKGDVEHRLEPGRNGDPDTARRRAGDPAPLDRPRRSRRLPHQPAWELEEYGHLTYLHRLELPPPSDPELESI